MPRSRVSAQRILGELPSAEGSWLGTAQLAERLKLHPNGVRVHVRRLAAQGLVEHERHRGLTGRPRDRWRLAPRAVAETDRPHLGWAMARSLAGVIKPTAERLREVDAAGVALGAEMTEHLNAEQPAADPVGYALETMGFELHSEPVPGGMRYRLGPCPYAELVRENPAVVCTLHKGIVRGALERLYEDAELARFEPRYKELSGCLVEVAFGERGR